MLRVTLLSTIFVIAFLASNCPVKGQSNASSDMRKNEVKAVRFNDLDEKKSTAKLRQLKDNGWEYVGPLGNGMVKFSRTPAAQRRAEIVGVWTKGGMKGEDFIEFTADGKIRFGGESPPLTSMFATIKSTIEFKSKWDALSYQILENGKFCLVTDFAKTGLPRDKWNKFSGEPKDSGQIVGQLKSYAFIEVKNNKLTIMVSKKWGSITLQRIR